MPDFLQVSLPDNVPKQSPEYMRWEKLNFALRQIYGMIDNVDGRLATVTFKNALSMSGRAIFNGPRQNTVGDTDFITKSYFRSPEFGQLCVNLLSSNGPTPLPSSTMVNTIIDASVVNTSAPLTGGGPLPITISIAKATGSVDGYLYHTDWTTFNSKVTGNAAISGATKTKITYDSKGLVVSGADATTADIADSSNKRYVADAELVVIGNTSGTNSGDNISGSVSQVGAATTTFTVSIGVTMSNTTYKVVVTPTNVLAAALFYVTNKQTTTFDVVFLGAVTGTATWDWAVFK